MGLAAVRESLGVSRLGLVEQVQARHVVVALVRGLVERLARLALQQGELHRRGRAFVLEAAQLRAESAALLDEAAHGRAQDVSAEPRARRLGARRDQLCPLVLERRVRARVFV